MIILTVAVIAATVWSYRYFGKYSPFASLLNRQDDVLSQISLTIDNARISVRSGGQPRLKATAREVTFSRDRRTVFVNGIHDGVLFDQQAKPQVHFDAGQMVYNTPSGEISTTVGATVQLSRRIHASIVRPVGPNISTDELTWNATTGEVHAQGDVQIDFPKGSGIAVARDVVYNAHSHDMAARHVHGTFRASKLVQ